MKILLLLVHGTQCFHRGLRACSVRTFLCRSSRITSWSLWKYTRDFSGKNNCTILNQVTQTAQPRGHQAADSRASWSMPNEMMYRLLRPRDKKHLLFLETGEKLEEPCFDPLLGKSSWKGKLPQNFTFISVVTFLWHPPFCSVIRKHDWLEMRLPVSCRLES